MPSGILCMLDCARVPKKPTEKHYQTHYGRECTLNLVQAYAAFVHGLSQQVNIRTPPIAEWWEVDHQSAKPQLPFSAVQSPSNRYYISPHYLLLYIAHVHVLCEYGGAIWEECINGACKCAY